MKRFWIVLVLILSISSFTSCDRILKGDVKYTVENFQAYFPPGSKYGKEKGVTNVHY